MLRIKWAAVVIFITLLLLAAGSGCRLFRQEESAPGTDTEDDLKSFTATALFSGEQLHFPDDFPEQAVYLLFFADG